MTGGMRGKVYLVGAGPGDPGMLTVRAAELLESADVVLYDRLVDDRILEKIPSSAAKQYVGRAVGDDASHQDATNELMASRALAGKSVVRLKGGDPCMFGRGGEEAEFLRGRNIEYEIVPGVTSGVGSATYSGIPLTHRGYSSSVAFVAGHEDPSKGGERVSWKNLAGAADTIVVMMGVSRLGRICSELAGGGMDESTPVAVIQEGTTERHRAVFGTLADISERVKAEGVRPPANVIIGRVVSLAGRLSWR